MRRTIPALPTLALAATAATSAGCGPDPLLGSWDGTYFAASGYEPLELPYQTTFTDENGTYDYFLSMDMRFVAGGTGVFSFHERFEQGGTVTYEADNDYAARIERIKRGVWVVDVAGYDGMLLECTAGKQALACIGDDEVGVDYAMDFTRREE